MKVVEFLQNNQVPFLRLVHGDVYTAQELAAREHVPGMKVAKPVLVRAGTKFVLCVVPAACRLDLDRVARLMGSENAALASESEMRDIFNDCEVGAEPPFGAPYGIETLMDESILADDYLVFQSGRHTEAVKVARTDYERLAKPRIEKISRHL